MSSLVGIGISFFYDSRGNIWLSAGLVLCSGAFLCVVRHASDFGREF